MYSFDGIQIFHELKSKNTSLCVKITLSRIIHDIMYKNFRDIESIKKISRQRYPKRHIVSGGTLTKTYGCTYRIQITFVVLHSE